MTCPDCGRSLDDVPQGNPCPQCGSTRRSAQATAEVAHAQVEIPTPNIKIGYSLQPGWTYQWHMIQRHLTRLREQYRGVGQVGNLDLEETVHALFLDLCHLYDWLYHDSDLSWPEPKFQEFVSHHSTPSLEVCRAYANTRKHMKRDRPGALMAQIIEFESGPKVKIGYRAWDQRNAPLDEVDALHLAERCEQDWRDILTQCGIPIPT